MQHFSFATCCWSYLVFQLIYIKVYFHVLFFANVFVPVKVVAQIGIVIVLCSR